MLGGGRRLWPSVQRPAGCRVSGRVAAYARRHDELAVSRESSANDRTGDGDQRLSDATLRGRARPRDVRHSLAPAPQPSRGGLAVWHVLPAGGSRALRHRVLPGEERHDRSRHVRAARGAGRRPGGGSAHHLASPAPAPAYRPPPKPNYLPTPPPPP